MGCAGSKKRARESATPTDGPGLPKTTEDLGIVDDDDGDSLSGDKVADAECGKVLVEITQKVAFIRAKAEEYQVERKREVDDIEMMKAKESSNTAFRNNGVVLADFESEQAGVEGGFDFLNVKHDDRIEIIVRDAGGWAFCRKEESPTCGWLPATRITEISALIADHSSGESSELGLLNAKKGTLVEVVSRHYSGWAFCREWRGGTKLPNEATEPLLEGWVTDAYLEDRRSEVMLATKWQRLILEALDRVVSTAKELEGVLTTFQAQEVKNDFSTEWMEQCLEFMQWLASELTSIEQATSQLNQAAVVTGCYATLNADITASGEPNELRAHKGDRVLILNADNADWIWCRADDGKEGWVLRSMLAVEAASTRADGEGRTQERMKVEDLPKWLRTGQDCRWLSKANDCYYEVKITKVSEETQEVEVVFSIDTSCWKRVPFSHFLKPVEEWRLQESDEKAKELRFQLPEWVEAGRGACWWSEGQRRCFDVIIRDVDFKRRLVFVAFKVDATARKNIPFVELIDNRERAFLQKNKQGHAWRMANKDGDIHNTAPESPTFGSPKIDFKKTAAIEMDGLINGICDDVGDMMRPEDKEAFVSGLEWPAAVEGDSLISKSDQGNTRSLLQEALGLFDEAAGADAIAPAPFASLVHGAFQAKAAAAQSYERNIQESVVTPNDDAFVVGTAVADAILPEMRGDNGDLPSQPNICRPITTETLDGLLQIPQPDVDRITTVDMLERQLAAVLAPPSTVDEVKPHKAQRAIDSSYLSPQHRGVTSENVCKPSLSNESSALARPPSPTVETIAPALEEEAPFATPGEISSHEADVSGVMDANATAQPDCLGGAYAPSEHGAKVEQDPRLALPKLPFFREYTASEEEYMEGLGPSPTDKNAALANSLDDILDELGLVSPKATFPRVDKSRTVVKSDELSEEHPLHPSVGFFSHPSDSPVKAQVPTVQRDCDPKGREPSWVNINIASSDPDMPSLPPAWSCLPEMPPKEMKPAPSHEVPAGVDLAIDVGNCESAPHETALSSGGPTVPTRVSDVSPPMPPPPPPMPEITAEQRALSLLRESERLLVADTWDSEAEASAGRTIPDAVELCKRLPEIEGAFEAVTNEYLRDLEAQLETELVKSVKSNGVKRDELQQKLTQRSRNAEWKQDSVKAQRHRTQAWSIGGAADIAEERRRLTNHSRVSIKRRRAARRKAAIRKALVGGNSNNSVNHDAETSPGAVEIGFPLDEDVLADLSAADAVAEAAETARLAVQALEVASLQPLGRDDSDRHRHDGWQVKGREQQGHGMAILNLMTLVEVRDIAINSLVSTMNAVGARLQVESDRACDPDPELELIAKDDDVLTKDQKRDRKLFEGQQEFDLSRQLDAKVIELTRRHERYSEDALQRLQRVLQRRCKRQRDRDRAGSLAALKAFSSAIARAEGDLQSLREEYEHSAADEVAQLRVERRKVQGQTQHLLLAAMVIREEKARMSKAYETTSVKERQKLMLKALRRVRRLNIDMKALDVMVELKQKHSVLLYSLRMLETRLSAECVGAENEVEDAPLKLSSSQQKQLSEAEQAFEDELAAEVERVLASHRSKADQAVLQMGKRLESEIAAEHVRSLEAARVASDAMSKTVLLSSFAPMALRPFLSISSTLAVEACRLAHIEAGPSDASGFGPQAKRVRVGVEEALVSLNSLTAILRNLPPLGPPPEDREWQKAISHAEDCWNSYRNKTAELEKARKPASKAKVIEDNCVQDLREALDQDECDSPTASGAVSPLSPGGRGRDRGKGGKGATGGKVPTKAPPAPVPVVFATPAPPPRPPSATSVRPGLGATRTSVAGGRVNANAAKAIVSQLDELSSKIDKLCGGGTGGGVARGSGGLDRTISGPSKPPARATAAWS